jgi:hypothetical protein
LTRFGSIWRRSVVCVVALAMASLSMTRSAQAAPTSQDRALAESLFREAKALAKAGELDVACPKFAESQRLDPQLGTLLHLATCHEQQGLTATAWAEFGQAVGLAKDQRDKKRGRIAERRAKALEAKLSHLVVTAESPPEALEVVLDGRVLSSASLGTRLPVDPGEHELEARAPGRQSWTKRVDVPDDPSDVAIAIPKLSLAQPDDPKPNEPATPTSDPASSQRLAGWIVGGVGVVGLGLMAGFGAAAASQASSADEECDGSFCSRAGLDGHATARTSATISTVGLVVGVLGVGGGLTLLLTAPSSDTPAATSRAAWLAPFGGPTGAGLTVGARW